MSKKTKLIIFLAGALVLAAMIFYNVRKGKSAAVDVTLA